MNGQDFRLERLRFRVTQRGMSNMSGVPSSRISRYELDEYEPDADEHERLQHALRRSAESKPWYCAGADQDKAATRKG